MAYRFVRARPETELMGELRQRLDDGEIATYEPFGEAMTTALENARFDPETGEAVWVEASSRSDSAAQDTFPSPSSPYWSASSLSVASSA